QTRETTAVILPQKAITVLNFPAGRRRLLQLVLGGGEFAVPDFAAIARHRLVNDGAKIGILPGKFWHEAGRQAEQIVRDKDLPITLWPSADADRGYLQGGRNVSRHRRGDAFQDDGESPG